MDATLQGYVRTDINSLGVADITFFHPLQNSLPARLLSGLANAITEAGRNEAVKVVVLRSAEHKTFCAGASFDELTAINDLETGVAFFSGFGNVINAMRKCPKILVARVHGKSVGGGVGLSAAADVCLATQWAAFRLSELAVGFGPFVIGPAVERKTGVAAFTQLALTPDEWRDAIWGKSHGLYQEVFDTAEQMDEYLDQLCGKWASYSQDALQSLKKVFWEGTDHWDTLLSERAAISGRLSLTPQSKAAIEAFKNAR
jgi:methylglutaconyl-CoA hydratase